jgi:hypothetical protein
MRTDTNQRELPLDAPMDVLLACKSEEQAVRTCLDLASKRLGRDQQTVALICGWKSDSCLSEIANPRHSRKMPKAKRERFALATGCNLLSQFLDYEEAKAKAHGKPTERQQAALAADACLTAWGIAA